ncbi:MarR family winged helix-turn-helix transcriptional regulator [Actinacidiphila epipremni]|jgi:DNA-binding MarR family transcriptional regulator|uniref:Winged helix-turn-helix transcriptional regulator n=1 Tax=Actinacidiphila epipremni TaxID=2053013 RepID=A0ABX0ZP96_9ACTN|nr:MarR family winged helix-turn-helix transcriptional regulator [Actinacidiphila epipremni]NJP45753.1 winged helix-turn-helix transcriptional regulator [Actinacidiphila epipremni]
MSTTAPELNGRLGHLLKHAQARLAALNAEALEPFGISGRELAVLLVIAGQDAPSQARVAGRLGVDRTTMVAFLDTLEGKGLLARRPDPGDRRRNVVVLTDHGTDTLRRATAASDEAERRFLAPLTGADAATFRSALTAVASYDGPA